MSCLEGVACFGLGAACLKVLRFWRRVCFVKQKLSPSWRGWHQRGYDRARFEVFDIKSSSQSAL